MKNFLLISLASITMISLIGCQEVTDQVAKFKDDATHAVSNVSTQLESAKSQAIDAKNKLEEKVQQAQAAADAINKLTH